MYWHKNHTVTIPLKCIKEENLFHFDAEERGTVSLVKCTQEEKGGKKGWEEGGEDGSAVSAETARGHGHACLSCVQPGENHATTVAGV